ncbi:Dbl homology domain-containing protein [Coprinopsis marcescibilis]|uniref:Dbl homology domain-containing protein n=1 Tax=Coprinopsis marcescibilis TaxID=230819 RepID=A0A5C3KPB7_COPMA|nr:Dbl homology domain-containing protein [Coprinopsis marcescibilis]
MRCSPRRPNLGFLPLPSIQASPICTPTSSIASHDGGKDECASPGSAKRVSVRVLVSTTPPTWISTPPTPPIKSTGAILPNERAPTTGFVPSASCPASTYRHGGQGPRLLKCTSVPDMRHGEATSPTELGLGQVAPSLSFRLRSFSNSMLPEVEARQKPGLTHSKPIFHLPNPNTDIEDEGADSPESAPRSLNDDFSPDGSWSDCSPEDVWEEQKYKDDSRRFHALKELLSTELGYVADLKTFVTVYLRNLPTLAQRTAPVFNSTFGRASASFASGPWVNSHSYQVQPEQHSIPPSISSIKDVPKPTNTRYLFTDSELELITRNAEDLLLLHEHFLKQLSAIVEPLGITMEHSDQNPSPTVLKNVDTAVRMVSAQFATEASRFNAYQSFCAGHLEVLDLVRRVSQQHASEWEAFEQRCSVIVSDLEAGKVAESEPKPGSTPMTAQLAEDRTRALSLTSLDGAVRSLRMLCPTKEGSVAPADARKEGPTRMIAFTDYMIKPVQRICKYPLLLKQLLTASSSQSGFSTALNTPSDVDVVVKSATQAMRHVASSVDEARHRQDVALQSSLISSRIFLGGQALLGAADTSIQTLTAEFLTSLGTCLLAGSLDVMHHHPLRPLESKSNFKAKYYGAFLYPGGYFILAKVFKGRKYEPKHWFSLSDFRASDVEEVEAMLPHSIRISCGEQHFELAASCQKEKDVWLSAIRESAKERPNWVNEPTPSFKFDEKGVFISSLGSESEISSALPTIQSIPELSNNLSDAELSEPFFASLRGPSKSKMRLRRYDVPPRPELSPSTSRRSSSTSVKSIFTPTGSDAETIVIRRSSPVARLHVDQALQDVTSAACLNARMYAFSHDEELFRSGSGLGRTKTKSRLSKHESIRVPRSRTADSLDGLVTNRSPRKGTIASRRNAVNLSITSFPPLLNEDEKNVSSIPSSSSMETNSPPSSARNPPILAHSDTTSTASSGLLTPTISSNEGSPLRPSKSLVRGVKDLFHIRHNLSPTTSAFPNYTKPHEHHGTNALHRWTMDSIRRRPRHRDEHNHPASSSISNLVNRPTVAT